MLNILLFTSVVALPPLGIGSGSQEVREAPPGVRNPFGVNEGVIEWQDRQDCGYVLGAGQCNGDGTWGCRKGFPSKHSFIIYQS